MVTIYIVTHISPLLFWATYYFVTV